jgi:protein-S-isoprenylcysteine O-methyltransferase Ste14
MARLCDRIIDFIYRKATIHHGLLTVLGGLFFSGAIIFIIFLALLSDKLLGLCAWPSSSSNLILSIPLLAAGIWLWLWSVLIFIKSKGTPLFMVLTFLEFKMIEEPELEKRIGAAYVEYRQKVPMFFPYPGRSKH